MFFILFYNVSIVNLAFWKLKENYCCAATNLDVLIREGQVLLSVVIAELQHLLHHNPYLVEYEALTRT